MQGSELRGIRKAAGLSQAELADILDLSPTYIGQMERGRAIECRTELVIEALIRTRIDVSYSKAVNGWIVALTRPAKSPAAREHHLLAVKPTKKAAQERAREEMEKNPFATLIVRHETAPAGED